MTGPEGQSHFDRIAAAITELDSVQDVYGHADSIRDEGLGRGRKVEEGLDAAIDNVAAAQEEIGSAERQAQEAYKVVGRAILGVKMAMEAVDSLCTLVDRSRDFVVDAEENLRTRVKDHEAFVNFTTTSFNSTAQEGKSLVDAVYAQFSTGGITTPEAPQAAQDIAAKAGALKEGADSYAEAGERLIETTSKVDTVQMVRTAFGLRDIHQQFDTASDAKLTVRLPIGLENALGILEESRQGIEEIRQRMNSHSDWLNHYRLTVDGLQDGAQDAIRILVQNEHVPGEIKTLAASTKADIETYLTGR